MGEEFLVGFPKKKKLVTIKDVHKGDHRNGTKYERRETNDTPLGNDIG